MFGLCSLYYVYLVHHINRKLMFLHQLFSFMEFIQYRIMKYSNSL